MFRLALENFEQVLRPGGILIIDHRNYDQILDGGTAPSKSIYYNVSITEFYSRHFCIAYFICMRDILLYYL